ncbi:hypothetical protein ABZ922_31545 [Streptomyces shenzhenensis]|uniref:hypothetical protein n=1 Tax=Streptomyces shenzhenensis TaxID=943815 RepID=UPI0033E0C901
MAILPNRGIKQADDLWDAGEPSLSVPPHSVPLDVSGRVCVTPPYFALRNVRQILPGTATASVYRESDVGRQASNISFAEAGRHMAILGLCAASSLNPHPGRHYYLARTVHGEWLAPARREPTPAALECRAKAAFDDRRHRHATARAVILGPDGTPEIRMTIRYEVIPERIFERLFSAHAAATGPTSDNPYKRRLPFDRITVDDESASASLTVTPDLCPGHFDGYPALPASIIGTAMTSVFDEFLAKNNPSARWTPTTYQFGARELAWVGKTMDVSAELVPAPVHQNHILKATVRIGADVISTLDMRIQLINGDQ